MTSSRYFLALCAVLLLVAAVRAEPATGNEIKPGEISEGRTSYLLKSNLDQVMQILRKSFKRTKDECLMKAASSCMRFWDSRKKLIKCAKPYLKANKKTCSTK